MNNSYDILDYILLNHDYSRKRLSNLGLDRMILPSKDKLVGLSCGGSQAASFFHGQDWLAIWIVESVSFVLNFL